MAVAVLVAMAMVVLGPAPVCFLCLLSYCPFAHATDFLGGSNVHLLALGLFLPAGATPVAKGLGVSLLACKVLLMTTNLASALLGDQEAAQTQQHGLARTGGEHSSSDFCGKDGNSRACLSREG